jgi:hypothetical protein
MDIAEIMRILGLGLGLVPPSSPSVALVPPTPSANDGKPNFILENSVEINPIDLSDNFHSFFFVPDIQSSLTILRLINSDDKSNPIFERGRIGDIIIVFSKSSNKHYLFYRYPSFLVNYENAIRFKRLLESKNNEYSDEKFDEYLCYFENPSITGMKIFKKIINTEPTRYKCINLLEFPNGSILFTKDSPEEILQNCYILHYNNVLQEDVDFRFFNKDQIMNKTNIKVNLMKKYNHWFI